MVCNGCGINESKIEVYAKLIDGILKVYLCKECAKIFKETHDIEIKNWEGMELIYEKNSCSN